MSLRLPFVLWTSAPPHHITAINDTQFPQWILTGSSDGSCCCCRKLNYDLKSPMVPQYLMISSSCSPVLSIAWVTWDTRNYAVCGLFIFLLKLFILLVYDNGDICIWNLSDGSLFCSFPFPCL
jgi:hypothetical protein